MKRLLLIAVCFAACPWVRADLGLWPGQGQWKAFYANGGNIIDPAGDVNPPNIDVVGDATFAAGALSYQTNSTGTTADDEFFVRLRINGATGTGNHNWQIWFNTAPDPTSFQWALELTSSDVELRPTTVGGSTFGAVTLSDTPAWTGSLGGFARLYVPVDDGSNFSGNPDYFMEFGIPAQVFIDATGVSPTSTAIRIAYATSTSPSQLNKDFPLGSTASTAISSVLSDSATLQTVAVPEPSGALLVGAAVVCLWCCGSRGRFRRTHPWARGIAAA